MNKLLTHYMILGGKRVAPYGSTDYYLSWFRLWPKHKYTSLRRAQQALAMIKAFAGWQTTYADEIKIVHCPAPISSQQRVIDKYGWDETADLTPILAD